VESKTLCCHILPSSSSVQRITQNNTRYTAAASAAYGVVDINSAQHDGGCAGDQTHSLRIAATAAAAASYWLPQLQQQQHSSNSCSHSARCRYCGYVVRSWRVWRV